ncbi:MAG: HAD-IC family P-type ATPase [bacterium]
MTEPRSANPPATPWHCLPPDAALAQLEVVRDQGLSAQVAARRLEIHGPNKLAEQPSVSPLALLLDQFKSFLILLLFGASLLAALIGHYRDAVVIIAVTLINSVLGFYQEYQAEKSLLALKRMLALRPQVLRDGEVVEIPAEDLVPGDIVSLNTGDRIAADGRLIEHHGLEVDESALTGESLPVAKRIDALEGEDTPLADRVNMVYMNTVVTRGRGWVLVTDTGRGSQMGRLADALIEEPEGDTPLQIQLDHLGKRLTLVAGVIISGIFALGLWQGTPLAEVMLNAIALAVAAIPEGLPAVVTVTLAMGMRRMVRHRAIVKRLSAVETLGCTTVICSDKTGTLTLNQMTVVAGSFSGRAFTASGEGYTPEGAMALEDGGPPPDWSPLLEPLVLCNDSRVNDGHLIGDPTEGALLVLAMKGGLDTGKVTEAHPRIAEIPFDSERKTMVTFHGAANPGSANPRAGERVRVIVKGAPERVVNHCALRLSENGPVPLDAAGLEAVEQENNRLAERGLRVLAIAEGSVDGATFDPEGDLSAHLQDLTFIGLAGLMDPPRPEAVEAIGLCRQAGIMVKMITGDQPTTAATIARALGMEGKVVNGQQLDSMSEEELDAEIETIVVFARVTAEHKMRIVHSLQARNHVVAMTGDGVNDAPALKAADIGIAMGKGGTEVAKEAAAMVLTDDNFATIVKAVGEGRVIYENIIKFMRFQLSTNLGAIFSVLGALLLGLPSPFNAIQLLWINIIMDGPPAMSLGMDQAAEGIMDRSPRRAGERILSLERLFRVALFGAVMMAGTLGLMIWSLGNTGAGPDGAAKALTLSFTVFVLFQFFNAFNARAESRSAFTSHLFTNRVLWIAIIATVVLQVVVISWPWAREIFHVVGLDAEEWGLVAAVAASILVLEELRKLAAKSVRKFTGGPPANRRRGDRRSGVAPALLKAS